MARPAQLPIHRLLSLHRQRIKSAELILQFQSRDRASCRRPRRYLRRSGSFLDRRRFHLGPERPDRSAEAHNTGSTTPVKGTLYRTDDGGTSRGPVKAEKSLEEYLTHGEEIVQLEFVDDEYGWAIARDGHNLTQLLKTTDGGRTWNATKTKLQR